MALLLTLIGLALCVLIVLAMTDSANYESAMERDSDKGWPDPDDHDPDRDHLARHYDDF